MRPFYIGKAKNIRKRLANHFSQVASSILTELDKQEISYHDIYIGYRQIERVSENEKLNGIFEEIAQRMLKPGLTIRPG
ncbi:MAG: GIY-YIG nuclease family protein [Leptospiraceae bacterium]|nr:GIY-YIG nuclease family protein [Leptospiraceae bacterium]